MTLHLPWTGLDIALVALIAMVVAFLLDVWHVWAEKEKQRGL